MARVMNSPTQLNGLKRIAAEINGQWPGKEDYPPAGPIFSKLRAGPHNLRAFGNCESGTFIYGNGHSWHGNAQMENGRERREDGNNGIWWCGFFGLTLPFCHWLPSKRRAKGAPIIWDGFSFCPHNFWRMNGQFFSLPAFSGRTHQSREKIAGSIR